MARIYKTDIIALKKILVEQNLDKITALSETTGLDRNTLSKILSGDAQPSSNVMDKLVSSLGMSPEVAGAIFFNPDLRNK